MSVCPFCTKAAVVDPQMPCPSCGRRASDPPSAHGFGGRTLESDSGWGDGPDLGGGLDLSRGGSIATHGAGPSAYAGGGLSLGDEDDPFADDAPHGALELDLPPSHTANAPRSIEPAPPHAASHSAPAGPPPSAVPDLVLPPKLQPTMSSPPQARPPASAPSLHARPPASAPSLHARPRASDPSLRAAAPARAPSLEPPAPASDPSLPPRSPLELQVPPARAQDPAALIARYPVVPEKVWEAPAYAMKVLWRQFELRQDLASLRKKRSPDVPLYERALETHDTKTFALGLALTCAGVALASFVFFLPVILRFLRAPD